jgi:DNA topoisomerase IB
VNDYLQNIMGANFTAKDFRTWGATLHAILLLAATALPPGCTERGCKREIARVVKLVAEQLRNTPAVCRKSYINPAVFEMWRCGEIHRTFGGGFAPGSRKAERLVLSFLRAQAAAR